METSYTQTIINGFKVTIFNHYNGTQLFINDRDGVQIYGHKVSGDVMERAKAIINASSPETFEAGDAACADKMISLSERRTEFIELKKGFEVVVDMGRYLREGKIIRFGKENGERVIDYKCPLAGKSYWAYTSQIISVNGKPVEQISS